MKSSKVLAWQLSILLMAAVLTPVEAWSQQRQRAVDDPVRGFGMTTGARQKGGGSGAPAVDSVDSGFVFLQGHYISSPYRIEVAQDQILINGQLAQPLWAEDEAEWDEAEWDEDEWDGGNSRRWRRRGPRTSADWLVTALEDHWTAIQVDQEPLVLIDPVDAALLLETLISQPRDAEALEDFLESQSHRIDENVWRAWLSSYQAPPELVKRARAELAGFEGGTSKDPSTAAVRRIDKLAYPLSVLGMIFAVGALGHLLSTGRPDSQSSGRVDASPQATRMVIISLILIVVLSALDLVWTILAWQAGQMRELNPLGSRMIDDPARLAMFKGVATFVSVGLLLGLRHYRIVQLATWWMCLICTVLAFRWLTFNSMFMG